MSDKKKYFKSSDSVIEEIDMDFSENISSDGDSGYEEVVFDATTDKGVIADDEEIIKNSVSAEEEEVFKDTSESKNKLKSSIHLTIYDMVSTVMGSFIIIAFVFIFAFRLVGVDGQSMTDTLQHGDWVLTANKSEYVQGDIIVITQDTYFHTPLIKRVIAVGGQTIDIDYTTATVYVNGEAIDEPYVREDYILEKMDDCEFPYTVPEGTLFCMGDNRNGSTDSRSSLVGPVDERQVLGKAIVRLFPLGDHNIYDYE